MKTCHHLLHALCQRWPFLRGRDALMRRFLPGAFGDSLAAHGPWITTRDGWQMKANMGRDYSSQMLKMFGELEPVTKAFLLEHHGPQGAFLDVGANVGYFSLLLAHRQPSSRVFAFEPNPAIACHLDESIVRNSLMDRLTLHPLAASDTSGTLSFIVDAENSGHSRLSGDGRAGAFEVEMIRLDDWLPAQLGERPLHVVKIDVEGAELRVLRGMKNLLQTHRPALVVEAYDHHLREFGDDLPSMRAFLSGAGYQEAHASDGNLYLVHYAA
jgi:FkbM family methyltransferase